MNEGSTKNIEHSATKSESIGPLEAISANVKTITSYIKKAVYKVLEWGKDTIKQIFTWIMPQQTKEILQSVQDKVSKATPKNKSEIPQSSTLQSAEQQAA